MDYFPSLSDRPRTSAFALGMHLSTTYQK